MLSRLSKHRHLWHGFWLLMLLAHARAVVAAWSAVGLRGAEADLLRPLGLTIASLFFFLKLADVRWLRFRTDGRSLAALVIIVALLHAQSIGLAERSELIPQVLAAAAALVFLEPVQRRWEQVHARMFARPDGERSRIRPPSRLVATLIDSVIRSPHWLIAHTATPSRAPPA